MSIQPRFRSLTIVALLALASFLSPSRVKAEVDHIITVVDQASASGTGKSLGTFAYDPATDTVYTGLFGVVAQNPSAIRKITNALSGVQTVTSMVSDGQLQLYYRDGNPAGTSGTPGQSGFLLNPLPIQVDENTIVPAYSFAVISDLQVTTGNAALNKRLYTYNLGQVAASPPSPTPPYNDGRDVFKTRVRLTDMQAVTGATGTTSNMGRQFAWSGDGRSIYFTDTSNTSTAVGGLWKVDALGPNGLTTETLSPGEPTTVPTRLLGVAGINTEPAVLSTVNDLGQMVDTIYFQGTGGNVGGIDKFTHNLTTQTTGAVQVHVSASVINDFFELTGSNLNSTEIRSMASDSTGNLYFQNQTSNPDRRGIYRLDTEGRIAKIAGYLERKDEFGGSPNSGSLRLQVTDVNYNNGTDPAFNVPLVMYAEQSPINLVAGVYAFQTGDFNRDNVLDTSDIELMKPELSLRGVAKATTADLTNVDALKFDMNGNNVVDWKDVKVLQQFADFGDGDVDLNGIVDMADYAILQANWLTSGKTFIQGDLSGDDLVNLDDYNLWAASAGYKSSVLLDATFVGLPGDADGDFDVDGADFVAWQTGFPATTGGTLGTGDLDGDLDVDGGDFAYWQSNFPKSLPPPPSIPGTATVPEPATGVLAMAAFGLAAVLQVRRRNQS